MGQVKSITPKHLGSPGLMQPLSHHRSAATVFGEKDLEGDYRVVTASLLRGCATFLSLLYRKGEFS